MGKQHPFSRESEWQDVVKQSTDVPQLRQPAFDPYRDTYTYNPSTGKKDMPRAVNPSSLVENGQIAPHKLPIDVVERNVARDELIGALPAGAGLQLKNDYGYLMGIINKNGDRLNAMNALKNAPAYTGDPSTAHLPSSYHQRYEWTLQKLRQLGVKDKVSYEQAKEQLRKESGNDWYNLSSLINSGLQDEKGSPFGLRDEDLYTQLSAQNVIDNVARPYALRLLQERAVGEQTQEAQKPQLPLGLMTGNLSQPSATQSASSPKTGFGGSDGQEGSSSRPTSASHFLSHGDIPVIDQFKKWKEETGTTMDVTPQELKKKGDVAVVSKKAVEKELNWLEGALIEKKLRHANQNGYGDITGYKDNLQEKLGKKAASLDGKMTGQERPQFGDWRDILLSVKDGLSAAIEKDEDISAAVGEFLLHPIDSFRRSDKEMEQLEQMIENKKEVLRSLDAVQEYERLKTANAKKSGAKAGDNPYPLWVSPTDPDHIVIDKKNLNTRDLTETTTDAMKRVADYAFNRKGAFIGGTAGAILGGGVGAVAGTHLGAMVDASLEDEGRYSAGTELLGGQNINETALRSALSPDIEGIRVPKQTTDWFGVDDPAEVLLSSGITSTGTLLADLMAAGAGSQGLSDGIARGASAAVAKARSTPALASAFQKAGALTEKATALVGKPLSAVANTEAAQKILPYMSTVFKETPKAALEGAIQFGVAQMLQDNPALSPQDVADGVADGAVFNGVEKMLHNVIMDGAKKASLFLAKTQLSGQNSGVAKQVIDKIRDAATLQSIEQGGLETLAEQMKAGVAMRKSAHVLASGVAEPAQSLAENLRKEGDAFAGYTGTAFLGDIIGGFIFGAMGIHSRDRRLKLDAQGDPVVDSKGNPVFERVPYATAQDIQKAIDQKTVQLYAEETRESISREIERAQERSISALEALGAEKGADLSSPQEEAQTPPISAENTPQSQTSTSPAAPSILQDVDASYVDAAEGTIQEHQAPTLESEALYEEGVSLAQEEVQAKESAPQEDLATKESEALVEAIKEQEGRNEKAVDPSGVMTNLVDTPQDAAVLPDEVVDPIIRQAAQYITETVNELKAEGIPVSEDTVRQYTDETAQTIAFLQSKGATLTVLPSIEADGGTKYGYFASRKGKDGEALQSIIALNLPETLKTSGRKVGDKTILGQKAFHEFNHRFRYAVDNNLVEEYSPVPLETLQSVKKEETEALQRLIESSPLLNEVFKAHLDSGLSEEQSIEELSSLAMETMYTKQGSAKEFLRHVAALDAMKQKGDSEEADALHAAQQENPSLLQKLVGKLPKRFQDALEPLQQYFQAAKAANPLSPELLQEIDVLQKYYDAAVQTVTKQEAPQAPATPLEELGLPEAETPDQNHVQTSLSPEEQTLQDSWELMFSSANLADMLSDGDTMMDIENMGTLRKIPTFLSKYFGLKNTHDIYRAFSKGGVFHMPEDYINLFVQKRKEEIASQGKEMTAEEEKEAVRFATKTWTKYQGIEPAKYVNLHSVFERPKGAKRNAPPVLTKFVIEKNPERLGGANALSKINVPAPTHQIGHVNWKNFVKDLKYLEQSLEDNGLDNVLAGNPLVSALKDAQVYTIGSVTVESPAFTEGNPVDKKTGRANILEEAKFSNNAYAAHKGIEEDLMERGYYLWNHGAQGGVSLVDLESVLSDKKKVLVSLSGMNKMFLNYYLSNYDQPFTYAKTKSTIGTKEVNLMNYVDYKGGKNAGQVKVVLDTRRIQKDFNADSSEYKQAVEQTQQLMTGLEQYVNNDVLRGYAYFFPEEPTKEDLAFLDSEYLYKKAMSVLDSLLHIQIDPSFDRLRVIDSYDPKTGRLKMMKNTEKYLRGVVAKNSVPLTRELFMMLPAIKEHVKDGKLDLRGLEDDGENIYARGFVMNTKNAKEIFEAFPLLADIFNEAVIDGGVLSVFEETQDLLTLLGAQEGKSNKTHSHNRTANGALNFKQAIHRYVRDSVEQGLSDIHPVYQQLRDFMSMMKAANIHYIIPDSALKARAQYIPTKNVPTKRLYGKDMVLGVKGDIVGEWDGEKIKPTDLKGYPRIVADKEPFHSPLHPTVQALNQGHGMVKIAITGAKGLQWIDSIALSKKKPKSGGLPVQLFAKGHYLIDPKGANGLRENPELEGRLAEAGYGGNNAFHILTDRIIRHGGQRNNLWDGYLSTVKYLGGGGDLSPQEESDIIFLIEELRKQSDEDIGEEGAAISEAGTLDNTLLRQAVVTTESGEKKLVKSVLAPLFLLSDTLLENHQGRVQEIKPFHSSGSGTLVFRALARIHDDVARVKGRGALPVLVPDIARGMVDTARAKVWLTKTLKKEPIEVDGEPLMVDGKPFKLDAADYLKDENGKIDMGRLKALLDEQIDEKTGMFKDGSQGVSLGYDIMHKIGAKLGDKIFLTVIPMTDTSDCVPMVITGVSNAKGSCTYNKELMLKVQGRDHDIDKVSVMLTDPTWTKLTPQGEVDTFELLHDLLTWNEAHKAWGKKMLLAAKEMVDRPDPASSEEYRQMYQQSDRGAKPNRPDELPQTTYLHPFSDAEATKPARQYIAEKIYEKFYTQFDEGLLPLDVSKGMSDEQAIEKIAEALKNNYTPQGIPVYSPLDYRYPQQAREFFGEKPIGIAASASNRALVYLQAKNLPTRELNDYILRQHFQLSFSKEGAVDRFSNSPYEVDPKEIIASLASTTSLPPTDVRTTSLVKSVKETYELVNAQGNKFEEKSNIGFFRGLSKKNDYAELLDSTGEEGEGEPTLSMTSQRAALRGLSSMPMEFMPVTDKVHGKPTAPTLLLKKDYQVRAGSLFREQKEQLFPDLSTPETKARLAAIEKDINGLSSFMLHLFTKFDNASQKLDYSKVFDIYESKLSTSTIHTSLWGHLVNSSAKRGSLLDVQKDNAPLYTKSNPLNIVIQKGYNQAYVKHGLSVGLYSTQHPDTGFADRQYAVFTFPQPLVQISAGYTNDYIHSKSSQYPSWNDVFVEGKELHIPADKLFGYTELVDGVEVYYEVNPLLDNAKGFLTFASEAMKAHNPKISLAHFPLNTLIESMLVQPSTTWMPTISRLGLSYEEKQALFSDIITASIRKHSSKMGISVEESAGLHLSSDLPLKPIANYLKNNHLDEVRRTLHKSDYIALFEKASKGEASPAEQRLLLKHLSSIETANNGVRKYMDFGNAGESLPLIFTAAGSVVYTKLLSKGIRAQIGGKSLMAASMRTAMSAVEAHAKADPIRIFQETEALEKALGELPNVDKHSGDISFSDVELSHTNALEALQTMQGLLPTAYMTNSLTQETIERDFKRLLNMSRGIADTLSSWHQGIPNRIGVSPEQEFSKALGDYMRANNIPVLDAGKPEHLSGFLHDTLKNIIGEETYNSLKMDEKHPTHVMASIQYAAIQALSPELALRNEFILSKSIKDTIGKQAVQLNTIKDIFGLWADIHRVTKEQKRRDDVENLTITDDDGAFGRISKSFRSSVRRMNPFVRGTSKSLIHRYSSFLRPQMSNDVYYQTTAGDGNGGVRVIPFRNHLLENTIAPLHLHSYFTPISVSAQYADAADIERLKSFEIDRVLRSRISAIEDQYAHTPLSERGAASRTTKLLSRYIGESGLHITAGKQGNVPFVNIESLGESVRVEANDLEANIDAAVEVIRKRVYARALLGDVWANLAQDPHLATAGKAFIAKLLYQAEQREVLQSYSAQLDYLQKKLQAENLHGVAQHLRARKVYFDHILEVSHLDTPSLSSGSLDEGDIANPQHVWALGYIPQIHQSDAAFAGALRRTLISLYDEYEAEHGVTEEEKLSNREGVENLVSDALLERSALRDGRETFLGRLPAQEMSQPSIAQHGLPRYITEALEKDAVSTIVPVNADVFQRYSENLSKSYLSSVSFALEHLYNNEIQKGSVNGESPENAFVHAETIGTLTELRGDALIWDKAVSLRDLEQVEKGSPIQLSYADKNGKAGFTAGYFGGLFVDSNGATRAAVFNTEQNRVQYIPLGNPKTTPEGSIPFVGAMVGRPSPSILGIMKTSGETLRDSMTQAFSSPFAQENLQKGLSIITAPAREGNLGHKLKQNEQELGSYIHASTRPSALKKFIADSMLKATIYGGYLGLSKVSGAAITGLAGLGAWAAGIPAAPQVLFGASAAYIAKYFGQIATKGLNNIVSSRREHANIMGLKRMVGSFFDTRDDSQKEAQRTLQALPQFTEETMGLTREYTRPKAQAVAEKERILSALEGLLVPNGRIDETTRMNFLTIKRQQAEGSLSYDDVRTVAETLLPYLEDATKSRLKSPIARENLLRAAQTFGYEHLASQFYDEHGLTLDEVQDLRREHKLGMLKTLSLLDFIPRSETYSKRMADIASADIIREIGLMSWMNDEAKRKAIDNMSEISVGEFGNRNIGERTAVGRFVTLYSRFRRTANSFYTNDIMQHLNSQSFVHDIAQQYFPEQQYQYSPGSKNLAGIQGMQHVYSNIIYRQENIPFGDSSITDVARIEEFPYLALFQKKLRYATTLGAGLRLFSYGLPLLMAGAYDDEDKTSELMSALSEGGKHVDELLKESQQVTGFDSVFSTSIAFATTAMVEILSSLLYDDAIATALETNHWKNKEVQGYIGELFGSPDDVVLTLGIGKGAGGFTTLFADAIYGKTLSTMIHAGILDGGKGRAKKAVEPALQRREAMLLNSLLGSVIGADAAYSLVGKPAIEVYGAIEQSHKPTKKERTKQRSSIEVLSEKPTIPLFRQ